MTPARCRGRQPTTAEGGDGVAQDEFARPFRGILRSGNTDRLAGIVGHAHGVICTAAWQDFHQMMIFGHTHDKPVQHLRAITIQAVFDLDEARHVCINRPNDIGFGFRA